MLKQLIESDQHKCTSWSALWVPCVHSCTFLNDLLEDKNLQTINGSVNRGYNHGKQLKLTTFQRIWQNYMNLEHVSCVVHQVLFRDLTLMMRYLSYRTRYVHSKIYRTSIASCDYCDFTRKWVVFFKNYEFEAENRGFYTRMFDVSRFRKMFYSSPKYLILIVKYSEQKNFKF